MISEWITGEKERVKAVLANYSVPGGVSISSFMVGNDDTTTDLTDDNSAEFSIRKNGTLSCWLMINAAKDAAPGSVTADFELSRQ